MGQPEETCDNCDEAQPSLTDGLCNDCVANCERCSGISNIDDMEEVHITSDSESWCENCVMYHAVECCTCRNQISIHAMNTISIGSDSVCGSCAENNVFCCDACGEIHWNDDSNHCDRCQDLVCDYCLETYHDHSGMHDYNYKPDAIFHDHSVTHRYMGVELEVDGGDDRSSLIEGLEGYSDDEELFYLKEDGSLDDGVEIVTHPGTFDFHMTTFPWLDVLTEVKSHGFKSHDAYTCGIHVHVDRRAFGKTSDKRDYNLSKLIILFWKHWDKIVVFSRRKSSQIEAFAQQNYSNSTFSIDGLKEAKQKDRHSAINTSNYHTIELRIFRGSLRYETVMATIQFVNLLLDIVNTKGIRWCYNSSWSDIVALQTYPELSKYLKERGICA